MSNIPLEGIRVISFGSGIAIPDATKILGELGADVIKIESKVNPDFMRTIASDPNNSPGFNESNRNKRSFGVNLTIEKGKQLVNDLIKDADIVTENFRSGVMDNLGFGYESVCKIKPDIIYISTQGYGKGGPYSQYRGYGPILSAASGLQSVWAQPDDEYGCGGSFPHPDNMVARQAVLLVLAALDFRRRTGKGDFIDIAQTEVAASLIGEIQMDYTINGRIQKPIGNQSPYAAPHNCYRCKGQDRWCAITVFTNDEWERFCDAIGNPQWTEDPKFSDTAQRLANVDELDKLVEQWTIEHDQNVVMYTMQAAGVAAGITQNAFEQFNDPQLQWQNAFVEIDHPVAGKYPHPNVSFNMQDMEFKKSTPAPLLGQHNDEICETMLNISKQEINQMKDEGILESVLPEKQE